MHACSWEGEGHVTPSISGSKRYLSRKLYKERDLFVLIKSSEFPLSQHRSEEKRKGGDNIVWKMTFTERERERRGGDGWQLIIFSDGGIETAVKGRDLCRLGLVTQLNVFAESVTCFPFH